MTCYGQRRGIAFALGLVFVVMVARTALGIRSAIAFVPLRTLALLLLSVGGLYFISHLLRAVRLAVICVPLLELTLRKAILLHLFVAPWSLVLPMKLDELVRANELSVAGRSWPLAIMALLIDRVMDAVLLLGLTLVLYASGTFDNTLLAVMIVVALLVICATFLALPIMLETAQRHVFAHHYHAHARQVLVAIDAVRRLLIRGRATIATTWPFLVLSSLCICALELAAAGVALLLMGIPVGPVATISLILRRTNQSWRMVVFNQPVDQQVALLTLAFLVPMLICWLLVALPYLDSRLPSRREGGLGMPGGYRKALGTKG
ncbi:MAG: hypothetical protein P4L92_12925 [Rudaea sp.]|nr:hypothetical protein [Rudaea sp.]